MDAMISSEMSSVTQTFSFIWLMAFVAACSSNPSYPMAACCCLHPSARTSHPKISRRMSTKRKHQGSFSIRFLRPWLWTSSLAPSMQGRRSGVETRTE